MEKQNFDIEKIWWWYLWISKKSQPKHHLSIEKEIHIYAVVVVDVWMSNIVLRSLVHFQDSFFLQNKSNQISPWSPPSPSSFSNNNDELYSEKEKTVELN